MGSHPDEVLHISKKVFHPGPFAMQTGTHMQEHRNLDAVIVRAPTYSLKSALQHLQHLVPRHSIWQQYAQWRKRCPPGKNCMEVPTCPLRLGVSPQQVFTAVQSYAVQNSCDQIQSTYCVVFTTLHHMTCPPCNSPCCQIASGPLCWL